MEDLRKRLKRNGFVSFSRTSSALPSIRDIAAGLGCRISQYSFLRPRPSTGRRASLSDVYGAEEFPPHTDGAHLAYPPDFLIMRGSRGRNASTLLWPADRILENLGSDAKDAEFAVKRSGRIFGVRFCNYFEGETRFRFNYDTMEPKNRSAANLHSRLKNLNIEPLMVDWKTTSLLLVDNHTVLHGRGKSGEHDVGFMRRWTLRKQ